jgi:hypothetical protein
MMFDDPSIGTMDSTSSYNTRSPDDPQTPGVIR